MHPIVYLDQERKLDVNFGKLSRECGEIIVSVVHDIIQ